MLQIDVLNQAGTKVSELELNEKIFGIEPNTQVLYDVINAQTAAMRSGTHKTKTRAEKRGGGAKPWRQKGTGRARHGSRRSPIWRGGGVTFGPQPEKEYKVKINKKVKKLAFKSALSFHLAKGQLIVVDEIKLNEHKTKEFIAIYDALNLQGRTLFVDVDFAENVWIASRNIPQVKIETATHTSVYDLALPKNLVLTTAAVKYFEEVLSNE